MNVRNTLEILGEKINDVFPKMAEAASGSETERKILKSIIADIQQRLAEIYGIIQREISSDDLNCAYDEAMIKYPERIQSITNMISVVALATKTKLNIPEFQKSFDAKRINSIDGVCLECFKIKSILNGKADPNANETYNKGIKSSLSYEDYKTGYSKSMSPGFIPGQVSGFPRCTPEVFSAHQTMLINARDQLDQEFKTPQLDDRIFFTYSSSNKNSLLSQVKEYRNPKSLFQTAANMLIVNRNTFFKKLVVLPETITNKLPELDVDYRHKFCLKVKKLIKGVLFKPDEKEQEYLDKLISALDEKNPYNAIHAVLEEIGKINKQAYLSTFKDHMQPIRDRIINFMKEYNGGKEEYVKHFGKAL